MPENKKSFLERAGLIRSVEPEPVVPEMPQEADNLPEVDMGNVSLDNGAVIDEVYAQSETPLDPNKDILRLDEFIKSLPSELPEKTKQITVGGILKASGIRLDDLYEDGETKSKLLQAAIEQTKRDHETLCEGANADIAKMEEMIETIKTKMQDSQARTVQLTAIFEAANARINSLMEFANGVFANTKA